MTPGQVVLSTNQKVNFLDCYINLGQDKVQLQVTRRDGAIRIELKIDFWKTLEISIYVNNTIIIEVNLVIFPSN